MKLRRQIFVFLFILSPVIAGAKGSGPFRSTMLYYGLSASPGFGWRQSFDLQYEYAIVPCPTGYDKIFGRNRLRGLGLSYHFNENYSEYGFRGFINPFPGKLAYGFNYFTPYIYLQANRTEIKNELNSVWSFNGRLGLGLSISSASRIGSRVHFKSCAQVGYSFDKTLSPFAGGIVAEIKIGIGVDFWQLKYKRQSKNSIPD